jgi:hypothetical protein
MMMLMWQLQIVETDDKLDEDGDFRYDNANCCCTHDPSKPRQPMRMKFCQYTIMEDYNGSICTPT